MLKYINLIFSLVIFVGCKTQQRLTVGLSLKDTEIYCPKDNFKMQITIKNAGRKSIKIPSSPIIMNDTIVSDIGYTIEKFNDSLNAFRPFQYFSELAPFSENISLTELGAGAQHVEVYAPGCYFFEKGRYRLSIKLMANKFDKNLENVRSNVVEFKVIEPFDPTTLNK